MDPGTHPLCRVEIEYELSDKISFQLFDRNAVDMVFVEGLQQQPAIITQAQKGIADLFLP